jgi:hypothetical protein
LAQVQQTVARNASHAIHPSLHFSIKSLIFRGFLLLRWSDIR